MHQGWFALATGFDVEVSPLHIGAKGLVLNHSYRASPIKYHQEGACGTRIALAATYHAPKSGCSSLANMALLYSVGHSIYRDRGGVVAVASFLNTPRYAGKAVGSIDSVRLASLLLVVAFLETGLFFMALFAAVSALLLFSIYRPPLSVRIEWVVLCVCTYI